MLKIVSKKLSADFLNAASMSFILTGIMAVTYGFGVYLFPLILIDIKTELKFSYGDIALIAGISQMGYLFGSFLCSLFASKISSYRLILGSAFLCGVCQLVFTYASNIQLICLLLLIQRSCSAVVWIPMVEIVSQKINFNYRSVVLSIASGGGSYGIFLNGFLCLYLMPGFGWRSVWAITGVITLIFSFGAFRFFRNMTVSDQTPNPVVKRQDRIGVVILNENLISLAILVIILFSGLLYIPFLTYLIPYLRDELKLGIEFSSSIWSLIGFVGIGSGVALGTFADRFGIKSVLIFIFASTSISALVLCFTRNQTLIILSVILFALVAGSIFGLPPAYISKVFTSKRITNLIGISNVALGIGMICGNYFGGWIKSFTGSFFMVYLSIGLSVLLLIPVTLLLPNERSNRIERFKVIPGKPKNN
jgi:predicted MFS family arabinose efflux permease